MDLALRSLAWEKYYKRNRIPEPEGVGQGYSLLVSGWLATGEVKGNFTEDVVLGWVLEDECDFIRKRMG